LDADKRGAWQPQADKGPTYTFFVPALGRLWGNWDLDESNRFPAEVEARMPRGDLALNVDLEAVTDPDEAFYVDALQPPEIPTLRRTASRQLEHLRKRYDRGLGAG
jgi:hypothetical protein